MVEMEKIILLSVVVVVRLPFCTRIFGVVFTSAFFKILIVADMLFLPTPPINCQAKGR